MKKTTKKALQYMLLLTAMLGLCHAVPAIAGQTGQQTAGSSGTLSSNAVNTVNTGLNAANPQGNPSQTYTSENPPAGQTDTTPQNQTGSSPSTTDNSQYKQDPTPTDYGNQYPGQGQPQ
jgi:hypothetical protein